MGQGLGRSDGEDCRIWVPCGGKGWIFRVDKGPDPLSGMHEALPGDRVGVDGPSFGKVVGRSCMVHDLSGVEVVGSHELVYGLLGGREEDRGFQAVEVSGLCRAGEGGVVVGVRTQRA